ncbi:uncharacterized protein V1510DRAFT_418533 [Dipodascopsis tothii]|uniref:uncharacterized protein n=1 Tax=Dipodascopsis tothii TaxID=44089 RepID=UPI0034CF76A3
MSPTDDPAGDSVGSRSRVGLASGWRSGDGASDCGDASFSPLRWIAGMWPTLPGGSATQSISTLSGLPARWIWLEDVSGISSTIDARDDLGELVNCAGLGLSGTHASISSSSLSSTVSSSTNFSENDAAWYDSDAESFGLVFGLALSTLISLEMSTRIEFSRETKLESLAGWGTSVSGWMECAEWSAESARSAGVSGSAG